MSQPVGSRTTTTLRRFRVENRYIDDRNVMCISDRTYGRTNVSRDTKKTRHCVEGRTVYHRSRCRALEQ